MGGWTEFFVTMFPAHQAQHQRRPFETPESYAAGSAAHGRQCGRIPRAHLVESIPVGLEDLRGTAGVQYTEDVLVRLTCSAQSTIDLTAMYWALLPDSESVDEKGFTPAQFEGMGAGAGHALYEALRDAAVRGVSIRILQSPGFSGQKQESDTFREEFPDRVSIHSIEMGKWYGGGGIMHQKIWIFDSRHVYVGSANMDWKSISQVKEMGIAVEDCPDLAADAGCYFESWWCFSALTPAGVETFRPRRAHRPNRAAVVEPCSGRRTRAIAVGRRAVCRDVRRRDATPARTERRNRRRVPDRMPGRGSGSGRTWDGDGLVHTINDARKSVCVSVMDFAPTSLFGRQDGASPNGHDGSIPTNTPVWWPSLTDAILSAVLTRKVYVRLLVSKWAHTSGLIEPMLRALQAAADAGRADRFMTAGQLEIKLFIIPGWDSTSGSFRKYPGHTRVNHTKYIVTDRRINIGTSNMTWDYFAATAGSSFNADHPALVRTLQAVFDRDWTSSYAWRLT